MDRGSHWSGSETIVVLKNFTIFLQAFNFIKNTPAQVFFFEIC